MAIKIIRTSTVPESLDILLKGQLNFLAQHFEIVAVSGDNHFLQNVKTREGVRVVPLAMQRKISPLKDFRSLIQLYRLFRKEKPQMVHSITPKAGLLSMVAAKLARVPIRVHTFTGLLFPYREGIMQKILIAMDKVLCASATHIFPEGKGVLQDLKRFKITSKPMAIIANGNVNGIDTSYFNPSLISQEERQRLRQQLGINQDDFVFVFVGRLVRDKGINELVAAFDSLSSKFTNIKLLFVGNKEEELDPLEEKTNLTITSNTNIIEAGYQNDVRPFFAISDALVFPSYREGFPNVVLQAGAMELPAIVTNISGCNEIVIEEKNGIIIPVKEIAALEKAMERLLQDTILFQKMKSNARSCIEDRYSQAFVWESTLKQYERLLAEEKVRI